jgi:general secretion pathway protein C
MLSSRDSFAVNVGLPSLVTGLLWCVVALSAGYWFLHFPIKSAHQAAPVNVTTGVPVVQEPVLLQRALGATAVGSANVPEVGRLQLLGVIADASGQGSALISLDGQAPKAYRVGQTVSEGLVLQKLSPRRAQLGATLDGPGQQDLQLPKDKTP